MNAVLLESRGLAGVVGILERLQSAHNGSGMRTHLEWIFYDGSCGFCHRWIRFVLAVDKKGEAFRFAPRTGETFSAMVPAGIRAALPASIVVLTSETRALTRSAAVLHIFKRLGGPWRYLAVAGSIVPASIRDSIYGSIARVRHRIFHSPKGLCPVVTPELMKRFAP
jgi:predicted DCC family thiol-disulfide oxidoreductase YuxK